MYIYAFIYIFIYIHIHIYIYIRRLALVPLTARRRMNPITLRTHFLTDLLALPLSHSLTLSLSHSLTLALLPSHSLSLSLSIVNTQKTFESQFLSPPLALSL